MILRHLGLVFGVLYFWIMAILFGGLLAETFLLYPNIFYDVPESLQVTSEFLVLVSPGDYFPLLGMISLGSGVLAIIFNWRHAIARNWFLGGIAVVAVGDFLLSALYMWERNRVMFQEGAAVHSVAYLQQVASEFEIAHWFRVGAAGVAAVLVFIGLLRIYRQHVWSAVDHLVESAPRTAPEGETA